MPGAPFLANDEAASHILPLLHPGDLRGQHSVFRCLQAAKEVSLDDELGAELPRTRLKDKLADTRQSPLAGKAKPLKKPKSERQEVDEDDLAFQK